MLEELVPQPYAQRVQAMEKRRWAVVGAVVAVLAAIFAWALFVPAADWLARHDIGNATGASLETARNNARGNLLALTAGIAALGALVFTARNFALQRRSLELAEEGQRRTLELAEQGQRRTQELTEQGQVTERYSKAIEHLGSEKLDIRIGGIYALERIARDSARDHPTVIDVLTAFIREHSPAGNLRLSEEAVNMQPLEADIQAAVSVIRRRDPLKDVDRINLSKTNLFDANLHNVGLEGADLTDAHLRKAELAKSHLENAILKGANLVAAGLANADLTGADLFSANLAYANLARANLTAAKLRGANLIDTNLVSANLSRSDLSGVNLSKANLRGANLSGADLSGAVWGSLPLPVGWRLSSAGRIERNPELWRNSTA